MVGSMTSTDFVPKNYVHRRAFAKKTGALFELHADLIECEIDVRLVSERCFNVQTKSKSIESPNCTLERVDRSPTNSAKSIGGGVACYSKTTMDVTELKVVGSEDFELMWLLSKALKLYLVVVYYPPDATNGNFLLSHLKDSIEKLAVEAPGYILEIGRDFNDLETSGVKEKSHCIWVKTSGIRAKNCLDKVFVSNTDLIDQAETIKTSFNTDLLAIKETAQESTKSGAMEDKGQGQSHSEATEDELSVRQASFWRFVLGNGPLDSNKKTKDSYYWNTGRALSNTTGENIIEKATL